MTTRASSLLYEVFLVLLLPKLNAQSIDLDLCIGSLTTASNCDYFNSNLAVCNSLRGSPVGDCYCPQTVFNALAGCQGEFRICNGNNFNDFGFEDPESGLYALWHSACDEFTSYTVTTPAIAEASITVEQSACETFYAACFQVSDIHASCTRAYSSGSDRSVCLCQSTALELASVCETDGGSTCLQSAVTELYSQSYCPGGTATRTVSPQTTGSPSRDGTITSGGPITSTPTASVPGLFTTTKASTSKASGGVPCGRRALSLATIGWVVSILITNLV